LNVLLFGPPGAGKGTQSSLLVEKKGMCHISTGEIFRSAIKNNTELGRQAKSYMDKGELVPDSIVVEMVGEFFGNLQGRSFILDGFPRTVVQAEALNTLLAKSQIKIDKAIFLEVPHQLLLERLTGRRVCRSCGTVFHIRANPPKIERECDECGGELYQRDDDRTEVIRTRLEAYEGSTVSLKDFYKEKGCLVVVEGTGGADEVFHRIETILKRIET